MDWTWKDSFADQIPTNDLESFYDWFTREFNTHTREARSTMQVLKWDFGYLILNTVAIGLLLIFFLAMDAANELPLLIAFPLLVVYLIILINSLVRVRQNKKKRKERFFDHLEKGIYWKPSEKQLRPIHSLLLEVRDEMKLNNPAAKTEVLISNSPATFPSIECHDKTNYLILPLGLLIVAGKNNTLAKSLIAHEFAHIKIKDVHLWHDLSLYAFEIKPIMVPTALVVAPLMLAVLILGIWSAAENETALAAIFRTTFFTFILNISMLFSARRYFKKAHLARQRSEILADLMAAKYFGASNLAEALKVYGKDNEDPKGFHLPLGKRIAVLEKTSGLFG